MNPNSTPPDGLCGPVAASGAESKDRYVGATNEPQTAAHGPDPRAVILDAISTALNAAGYWLPIDGKRAVADAVLKASSDEAEKWRRQAVDRGLELGRLQRTLELAEATARTWADDHNGADCARAVLDALNAYPAKEKP